MSSRQGPKCVDDHLSLSRGHSKNSQVGCSSSSLRTHARTHIWTVEMMDYKSECHGLERSLGQKRETRGRGPEVGQKSVDELAADES